MGHTGTDLHLPQEPSPCPTERQARPAQLWVFIDVEGRVRNAVLHESSGDEEIDRAALLAVRDLEFTPALNRGRRVPVWVAIPIHFGTTCERRAVPVLGPINEDRPAQL